MRWFILAFTLFFQVKKSTISVLKKDNVRLVFSHFSSLSKYYQDNTVTKKQKKPAVSSYSSTNPFAALTDDSRDVSDLFHLYRYRNEVIPKEVKSILKNMDQQLNEVMREIPEDALIMIYSPHGNLTRIKGSD